MHVFFASVKAVTVLSLAILGLGFACSFIPDTAHELTLDKLIQQAKGEANYWTPSGEPVNDWSSGNYRQYDLNCKIFALKKIGEMGSAASAVVPDLIAELESGAGDYDTRDGVVPCRSRVAQTLGQIGDERAITPLLNRLAVREKVTNAGPHYNGEGFEHEAVVYALLAFGDKIDHAQPLFEQYYEERKTDKNYYSSSKDALAFATDFFDYSPSRKRSFIREQLPYWLQR